MVYPHLDCKVGCRRTAWWPSGSWIRPGLRRFWRAVRQRRVIEEKIEERISVPASIYEWKASEAGRERALAVQLENRRKFQQAFSQGLAVLGFVRDAEGNGVFELGPLIQAEARLKSQGAKTMKIDAIILRELHLPLVRPFETSFGVTRKRRILLAEIGRKD